MKYCSSYRQTKMYNYLNEIHFSRIFQLMEYDRQLYNNQILCLEILKVGSVEFNGKPTTFELYDSLLDKFPDLNFEFYELSDLVQFAGMCHEGTKYRWHYPADSYNMLTTLLDYRVSDIVLDEPLTFDIENVSALIRDRNSNCKIHIRPDIGKPGWMPMNESIMHHFWLLPQFVYLYEDYIDVIDLFAESDSRERRLIEAFCLDKSYDYELYAFVLNTAPIDDEMRGGWVTEEMARRRMNCKQKCMSTYPQACHECDIELNGFKMLALGRHRLKNDQQIT